MDINVLRGAILLVLIFSFIGLWIWAWSRKRQATFEEASKLPLEEDNGQIPTNEDPVNGKGSEPC
jgi:cytochrome c oxidase cbb3-type subunit 4